MRGLQCVPKKEDNKLMAITLSNLKRFSIFGRPLVKPFVLCYRSVVCLSCLSVCDVRALWPNGWTDQDETWHTSRPRPWPHCVRWGPSSPSQFSAHICCGQMAAWTKMSLGMELGLGPGDFVLEFYLSFFSSPNLRRRRLDVYHTSTHGVILVRI